MPASWPRHGPSAEGTREPIILIHPRFVASRTCSSISLHVRSGTHHGKDKRPWCPSAVAQPRDRAGEFSTYTHTHTHSSQTSQMHERTQMHRATRGSAELSSSLTRVSPSQPPCTPSPKETCSHWLLITVCLTDLDPEKLRHHECGNNDIKNIGGKKTMRGPVRQSPRMLIRSAKTFESRTPCHFGADCFPTVQFLGNPHRWVPLLEPTRRSRPTPPSPRCTQSQGYCACAARLSSLQPLCMLNGLCGVFPRC